MALRSGLSLWAYTSPSTSAYPLITREYAEELEELHFTTLAPGGYGQLMATLRLPNARIPRPELSLFSLVAVADGDVAIWLGEITDPEQTLDTSGEYVRITALGLGNGLRDDPLSVAYSNQTAQAIVADQLSRRANYLPTISQDTSQIFPDAPVATYAPVYDARNMEEVVADVATLATGSAGVPYSWGVWAHATQRNSTGFPLGQLVVHQQDTTTTAYIAALGTGEVIGYRVIPTAERAYNVVEIGYANGNSGYGHAIWTDPRLAANGSQNTAPFRRRKYTRDLSHITTINATQALAIATTYGEQFRNGQNKVQVTLGQVRDSMGNRLPLWRVRADQNLLVPDLAIRGTQIPTSATPGVNQFYIVQTTYSETRSGQMQLQVQGDNYVDSASLQIARLQLQSDVQARGGKVTGVYQVQGAAETGRCGVAWAYSTAGQNIGHAQTFRTIMAQTPTSITLTQSNAYNAATPTASSIDCYGFLFTTQCNGTGGVWAGYWWGTYQTNGNTVRAVRRRSGRFDWHCSACDTLHRGLRLREHLRVTRHPERGDVPGMTALDVTCPACGMVECFNTALTPADEDELTPGNYPHRAGQARLIRQMMRHPHIGLAVRP
jgi:hypothetical protein